MTGATTRAAKSGGQGVAAGALLQACRKVFEVFGLPHQLGDGFGFAAAARMSASAAASRPKRPQYCVGRRPHPARRAPPDCRSICARMAISSGCYAGLGPAAWTEQCLPAQLPPAPQRAHHRGAQQRLVAVVFPMLAGLPACATGRRGRAAVVHRAGFRSRPVRLVFLQCVRAQRLYCECRVPVQYPTTQALFGFEGFRLLLPARYAAIAVTNFIINGSYPPGVCPKTGTNSKNEH